MHGFLATNADQTLRLTVKGAKLHELLDMQRERLAKEFDERRVRLREAEQQAVAEAEAEQAVKAQQRVDRRRAGIVGMTQLGQVDLGAGAIPSEFEVTRCRRALVALEGAVAELDWLRSVIDAGADYTLTSMDLRITFGFGQTQVVNVGF